MSDSSQIPPAKPASILPVQTQGNAVSAASPARLLIHDVPVKRAPPALQNPPQPVHIEGRVISSNSATQELRIATASGEVTVQSSVSLPPDTLVSIDLSMQKGIEVATITLLRQQVQLSNTLEQLPPQPSSPPSPPLQAGDVVQAIFVPEPSEAVATPSPSAVPTLAQVSEIIKGFPITSLTELPGPLPLPVNVLTQIATAPDVLSALQKLPAAQQGQLVTYLARPDVVEVLQKILPPEIMKLLETPATPAAPLPEPPPEEDALDENLLQIVKVQTGARMAGTTPTSSSMPLATPETPSSPPPVLAMLNALLPLLEALQPQEMPLGALAQQLMSLRPAPGGMPLAELMPQSMYEVEVISIAPSGEHTLPPGPGELQGVVDSISPKGFPVIRVGQDLFVLKTLATVPRGSVVTFQAVPLTQAQAMATAKTTPTGNADLFHPLLSDSWPALQETLQAVSAAAPMLAQTLRDTIPAATPRLVPAALFFLAALRAGDIQAWLGEPVLQTLRQTGRLNLIDRLTGDFEKIAAQTKETVTGDWRAVSMPLRHDDQISQLQFFVRRQHENEENKADEAPATRPVTRFILNLRLSRMGDMQLDGLLHQKRFDLILRSAAQLPFSMRQELMQRFASGVEQAAMAGGISFQTKGPQWVKIDLPHQGTMA